MGWTRMQQDDHKVLNEVDRLSRVTNTHCSHLYLDSTQPAAQTTQTTVKLQWMIIYLMFVTCGESAKQRDSLINVAAEGQNGVMTESQCQHIQG